MTSQRRTSWRDSLRLAVGTLTAIPVAPPASIVGVVPGRAMALAPLVALLVTVPAAAIGHLAVLSGLPPTAGGLLTVGALAWFTRGLHLDGLADTADGLAASSELDRALAVMTRGDVGPVGVVTLLVVVGLQALLIGPLLGSPPGALLVGVSLAFGRSALALACAAGIPAARPEGLGRLVAGSVPVPVAALVWVIAGGILTAAGAAAATPWWLGQLAAVAALITVAFVVRRVVRRLGGITGDVLGAVVELSATTALLVVAAGGGR